MPEELRTAKLVASEQHYRCQKPVALSGTPDQVYRLLEGALVVVDTKRRPRARVYDADIAQLSIYRVLLAAQKAFRGQPLAAYGYVRLVTPAVWSIGEWSCGTRRMWWCCTAAIGPCTTDGTPRRAPKRRARAGSADTGSAVDWRHEREGIMRVRMEGIRVWCLFQPTRGCRR